MSSFHTILTILVVQGLLIIATIIYAAYLKLSLLSYKITVARAFEKMVECDNQLVLRINEIYSYLQSPTTPRSSSKKTLVVSATSKPKNHLTVVRQSSSNSDDSGKLS